MLAYYRQGNPHCKSGKCKKYISRSTNNKHKVMVYLAMYCGGDISKHKRQG